MQSVAKSRNASVMLCFLKQIFMNDAIIKCYDSYLYISGKKVRFNAVLDSAFCIFVQIINSVIREIFEPIQAEYIYFFTF